MDEPVIKIPLHYHETLDKNKKSRDISESGTKPYHAAPTTERPIHKPIPKSAHAYGETDSRKAPT